MSYLKHFALLMTSVNISGLLRNFGCAQKYVISKLWNSCQSETYP